MQTGFTIDSGYESVDSLFGRGGYEGMLWIVSFTMFTLSLGGLLEKTKVLDVVLDKLGKMCQSQGLLILTHAITSLLVSAGSASQVLAIVMPGRMYMPAYKGLKIRPEVCSRVCEDSGTIAAVLIPWGGCAIYFAGLFGVSTLESMLYSVFIWGSPLTTVLLGFLDKFIFKYTDEEYQDLLAEDTSI